MNNEQLKQISFISNVLEKNGYFDIQRIAKEILLYSQKEDIQLEGILKEIEKGTPWEYICQRTEFYGNIFKVSKDTLIPRIETEQLVDIVKEKILETSPTLVIDIGTGTGCIILSLAKEFKGSDIRFLGTDISKKALEIAKKNMNSLSSLSLISKNTSFQLSNLLENIPTNEKYCIVANLPYIPTNQYLELDKSVKDYEPQIALDGGENGLEIYEKLFKQILEKEKPLFLAIEFEPSTREELEKIVKEYFQDTKYVFKKDFREKERFLVIEF